MSCVKAIDNEITKFSKIFICLSFWIQTEKKEDGKSNRFKSEKKRIFSPGPLSHNMAQPESNPCSSSFKGLASRLVSTHPEREMLNSLLEDGLSGSTYNVWKILNHGDRDQKPYYRILGEFDVWAEKFHASGCVVKYWKEVQRSENIPEIFWKPFKRSVLDEDSDSDSN